LAELFSIPSRIVQIDDAQALEWQLVENSQRVDVHPYEEAKGFERLLAIPGYDVAALVEKSGKSASHIYARLSLLQLVPEVAEAFVQEHITASHANLIARLPQESQALAFEQCWRKDWQDKESHLLPAKHLSAWIQANLYLALADAPFDREDPTLNPTAGACVTCPRRSGYNTSLFCDVQGDQCKLCGIWATASIFCRLAPVAWPACCSRHRICFSLISSRRPTCHLSLLSILSVGPVAHLWQRTLMPLRGSPCSRIEAWLSTRWTPTRGLWIGI
jgi:hypothetical protein